MSALAARLARVAALLRDPRTPKLPRLLVVLACLYVVWPVDLVPDFIVPVLGYVDDAVFLWLSLRFLLNKGEAPAASQATEGAGTRTGG